MADDDIQSSFKEGEAEMKQALERLQRELKKLRTGKPSPDMVNGLMVEYYGNPTPMNQVGNISIADARTLMIQPWEKGLLPNIEKAIFEANLGLTPQNDGDVVRISIPPLTQERREQLVKKAKEVSEDAKVSIRNVRQKMMDTIKKEVKNGYPEDAGKRKEGEVQKMVDNFTDKVTEILKSKEKDIMTI